MKISSHAPGKIVLWGEYAVLAGAPARVMAVNRRAEVSLSVVSDSGHRFSSLGFLTPGVDLPGSNYVDTPVTALFNTICKQWGYADYPIPLALTMDTRAFFQAGVNTKLGLGSSAALCVALYRAMSIALDREANLAEAIRIHNTFQNSRGSGVDVAASWHGGVIQCQQAADTLYVEPAGDNGKLPWRAVFTGTSSSTPRHIHSFSHWRRQADTRPLTGLCQASEQLCKVVSMENLAAYTHALQVLDRAAELNIFTPPHRQLATIARDLGLVYKPCGAGGGDIGVVFADHDVDPAVFDRFNTGVLNQGLYPLDLEVAQHGAETGRE